MLLFSDLHLSPKTLPTCMKVLRFVHDEALRRNVPIGFLGDFFDRVYNEGTLPVDILNELMRFFSNEWRVHMYMIPGNHDYFDASETEHGLTPFQYCSKYIHVFDQPTMMNNQLWIPWKRDVNELKAIIDAHSSCDVIFGHFDIIGFKLNAHRTSTEGLSRTVFPEGVPVYTGHYHTPQSHGNVHYLGSPYQLSLSEAEDKKSLLIIDDHWHVAESIPIDFGRKQFKWTANELFLRSSELRPSDRVSVTCSLTDDTMTTLLASLREKGVDVQVRHLETAAVTRVAKQETLTPIQLLQAYAERSDIDQEAIAWTQIIQWVRDHPFVQTNQTFHSVRPTKMQLTGFGPFEGTVNISMRGDGFTLVSGECNNIRGASNGAGKSMVTAGGWLWACTGQIDGRGPLTFDKQSSIVHKQSDTALVTVTGEVDGIPWKIMRSLSVQGHHKKHTVRLFINHVERTRSTISATQRAIAQELFGVDMSGSALHQWLLRNSVWSQQSVSRWLDANDSQAKQEIHALANMDQWETLFHWCKSVHKENKEALGIAIHDSLNTQKRYEEAKERYETNIEKARTWSEHHEESVETLRRELSEVEKTYEDTNVTQPNISNQMREADVRGLRTQLDDARTCMANISAHCSQLKSSIPDKWFDKNIEEEEEAISSTPPPNVHKAEIRSRQCETEKNARQMQLKMKRQQLNTLKAKGICVTCGRAYEVDTEHQHHIRSLERAIDLSEQQFADAKSAFVHAQEQLIHVRQKEKEYRETKQMVEKVKCFHNVSAKHNEAKATFVRLRDRYEVIREKYERTRQEQRIYEETRRLRQELSRTIELTRQRLHRLENTSCPHDVSTTEMDAAKVNDDIATLKVGKLQQSVQQSLAMMKWTGPRGIQTYAMENTIQQLAMKMTEWLRRFFHTDDIEMSVVFDEKERLQRHIRCPQHAGVMSGGQWRRAQLASFMAWRDMAGASIPLLILDEACTSMDQDGIRSVQETIRDWCEEDPDRTCFFISHEPEQHRDTSVYQHHLKIVHKRGRSYIVDESSAKRQKK